MNVSHCLSSPWPGFDSRSWRSTARTFFLADHTRVQAKSLLMAHPGKRWVQDSVDQFLHHPWRLLCHGDTKCSTECIYIRQGEKVHVYHQRMRVLKSIHGLAGSIMPQHVPTARHTNCQSLNECKLEELTACAELHKLSIDIYIHIYIYIYTHTYIYIYTYEKTSGYIHHPL